MSGKKEENNMQIDFETLLKGIEDIQNHALNQHEIHLDSRTQLHSLEEEIDKISKETGKLKNENLEIEAYLYGLKSQGRQLIQEIAHEKGVLISAEEKRDGLQRTIQEEKQKFLQNINEHEKIMAEYATKFCEAPQLYKREKLEEITAETRKANEIQCRELDTLKNRKIKLQEVLSNLHEITDLRNLGGLIEEMEKEQEDMSSKVKIVNNEIENTKREIDQLCQKN